MTTNALLTQEIIEVNISPVPNALLTQEVIEVNITPVPNALLTQEVVEVNITPTPNALMTQEVVEVNITPTPNALMTQEVVEVNITPTPNALMTQEVVEVIITPTTVNLRVTQAPVEIIFIPTAGTPVSKSISTTWNVHQRVVIARDSEWNVHLRVIKGPQSTTWNVANNLPLTQDVVLWLKADHGVVLDDQNKVSMWLDHSGRNNHAEQANPFVRPQYSTTAVQGFSWGLIFDGIRDHMSLISNLAIGQDYTIIAFTVDERANDRNVRSVFSNVSFLSQANTPNPFWVKFGIQNYLSTWVTLDNVTALYSYFLVSDTNTTYIPALIQSNPNFTEFFVYSAINSQLGNFSSYFNYHFVQSFPSHGTVTAGTYFVGSNNPAVSSFEADTVGYWNGIISEIIVYNIPLSEANVQIVTAYLRKKYLGVTQVIFPTISTHWRVFPATTVTRIVSDNKSGVIQETRNKLSVLDGDNTGTFTTANTYNVDFIANSVTVVDLDSDTNPEIITTDKSSNKVSIFKGNSDGTFQTPVIYDIGTNQNFPLAANYFVTNGDFNNDTKPDLAIITRDSVPYSSLTNSLLEIVFGNGNGTLKIPTSPALGNVFNGLSNSFSGAVGGHFTSSGNPDIAIANSNSNPSTVTILLGNGDGTFTLGATYTVNGAALIGVVELEVGQFTSSGHLDIITNTGTLLLGNGDGTFTLGPDWDGALHIAVGVFTSSGHLDIVGSYHNGENPGFVQFFRGNGDGTFHALSNLYSVGIFPAGLTVGHFTSSGHLDAVVANQGLFLGPGGDKGSISFLPGNGNGTFGVVGTYFADFEPLNVSAGHFTSSGNLDLAVANINSGDISILLGNGNGTFQTAVNYFTGVGTTAVKAIDLNGDGFDDLVVDCNTGAINVSLGNGDGTFKGSVPYGSLWLNNVPPVVGNFSGGISPDIAILVSDTAVVSTLINNGSGGFTSPMPKGYGVGINPQYATVADFNEDGFPDLAVTNYLPPASAFVGGPSFSMVPNVTVILNNGDGTLQIAPVYPTAFAGFFPGGSGGGLGGGGNAVATGVFTSSGFLDLVLSDLTGVTILLGNGNGTFKPFSNHYSFITNSPFLGPVVLAVIVGQFTSSGHLDIVVTNSDVNNINAGQISIFKGNGDGTFQAPISFSLESVSPGDDPSSNLATGHFTSSGHLDLVVVGRTNQTLTNNTIYVLLGNGNGTFQSPVAYTVGTNPKSVATGVFTSSGKVDIVVACAGTFPNFTDGSISILKGNGDGTFQAAVSFTAGNKTSGITTGLFTGSGNLDVVVANSGANTISILKGNGNGTFQTHIDYDSGGYKPRFLTSGHFTTSGNLDLAVTSEDGNVNFLLGNGDGTFQTPQAYVVGLPDAAPFGETNSYTLATGDFNGDGKLDLAVTIISEGVAILINKGSGAFKAPRSYKVGSNPLFAATGHFTTSGHFDIVVPNGILLGNGNGSFTVGSTYSTGIGPSSVAVADFNGDGKLDIAVSNTFDGTISVLLGNNNGTFQAPVNYLAGSLPRSIIKGIFTSSGNTDLIVANYDSSTVSILKGNGNGTFQAPQTSPLSSYPSFIASGDFDHDGNQDLIGFSYVSFPTSPIIVTSPSHGLTTNEKITISGIKGGDGTLTTVSVNSQVFSIYEIGKLRDAIVSADTLITVINSTPPPTGPSLDPNFDIFVGDYIAVGDEIMQVMSVGSLTYFPPPNIDGTYNFTKLLSVRRGQLGTVIHSAAAGSIVADSFTNADNTWTITVIDTDHFSLNSSTSRAINASSGNWFDGGWNVFARPTLIAVTTWNVFELPHSPVSAMRSTTWNVFPLATKSVSTTWNVFRLPTAIATTTWNVNRNPSPTAIRNTFWNQISHVIIFTFIELIGVKIPSPTLWNVMKKRIKQRRTLFNVTITRRIAETTFWNVRSPVSDSLSTTWMFRGPVKDTRVARWNDSFAATTSNTNLSQITFWNVRKSVAHTQSTSWNVRLKGPLLVRSTTWNVKKRVIDIRSTGWFVHKAIIHKATATWIILPFSPGNLRFVSYNVHNKLVFVKHTSWNLQMNPVGAGPTFALDWQLGVSFNVINTLTKQISTSWLSFGRDSQVGRSVSTLWKMKSHIGSMRTSSWTVRRAKLKRQFTHWNVIQPPSFAPGQPFGVIPITNRMRFMIRVRATKQESTTWNVRSFFGLRLQHELLAQRLKVSPSHSTLWNVRQRVSAPRSTTWRVAKYTTHVTISTSWNTGAQYYQIASPTWNVRVHVTRTRNTTFFVHRSVSKTASTTWDLGQHIGSTRLAIWNNRHIISVVKSTTWNYSTVVSVHNALWNDRISTSNNTASVWKIFNHCTPISVFGEKPRFKDRRIMEKKGLVPRTTVCEIERQSKKFKNPFLPIDNNISPLKGLDR